MPELLTGTVTFFFSDIDGSTRLLQALGDRWPAVLDRHQELMRAAFEAHGGQEVGTEGDSFFAGFPTAPSAVAAAVEAQRALAAEPWPDGVEVRVRIGLHTGEAGFSTDTYAGLNVHRASRIANAGHGGQVLLSNATRTLISGELPDGVELRDLGDHRLKDLDEPERLWQLVVSGLRNDFPALRSLETPNNLPTRLTTFLGREQEIAEVDELLGRSRLLTLTGPGGTGKTRLSIEVARGAMLRFPDGAFFVELAPITEPALVIATIAQTLKLPERAGRSALDRLVDHVGAQTMLLVLDNFEQVTEAAPDVSALLTACPHLTILTSSRQALRVSGEQEYAVPPLRLPDPLHLPPLAQLSQYEAVALFVERARTVKADFAVTNENAPAVAEICVRLDGLPLAIELAAARIRVLNPQAILGRLEHRLGLLAGGSRDLPERQQTLRGAIAWSHDLLDEPERALFACLSVFVGGARYDAVERICGGEVSADLLDLISSLVEKSLVRQSEGTGAEPRFAMLETIREFAMEQAVERGRWDGLRERHAELFASLAAETPEHVFRADSGAWLDRLEEDHDNLRAAMAWAVEHGRAELALRTGAGLWRFWQIRGHLVEGLERIDQALAMPGADSVRDVRADALDAAAGLAYWTGDNERSRVLYGEEIELRRALDDMPGLAEALYGTSFTWSTTNLGDPENVRAATLNLDQALALFRKLDDQAGIARSEWALGNILWGNGDAQGARAHTTHALELFEAAGNWFMTGWASYTLGLVALSDDQAAGGSAERRSEAGERFKHAARIFRDAHDVTGYTLVLDGLAVVANRDGDRDRAARLLGAVAALERSSGTGLAPWNRGVLEFDAEALLADPSLDAAYRWGQGLDAEQAVAYALDE
jgi:predicted ATPase/class 3 adenylate cyclase